MSFRDTGRYPECEARSDRRPEPEFQRLRIWAGPGQTASISDRRKHARSVPRFREETRPMCAETSMPRPSADGVARCRRVCAWRAAHYVGGGGRENMRIYMRLGPCASVP